MFNLLESRRLTLLVALVLSTLVSVSTTTADAPVVLDRTKQLFLDDGVIESTKNVRRIIHPAVKHPDNPIVKPDSPWENGRCFIYGSVLKEKDLYRMWYYTTIKERPELKREGTTGVAYAESEDGIHWRKPELDFIAVDGRKTNVLIERDRPHAPDHPYPYFYELFGVHRCPKSGQYVMGFLSIQRPYSGPSEDPYHRGARRGLGVATSPDGLQWTIKDSFTTDSICDGDTHWMFDAANGRYVLYGRTKHRSEALLEAWSGREHFDWVKKHYWGRAVARIESPDFLHWNHTKPAEAPVVMAADEKDEPGTEIYSMLVFPYESVYIGLVQVFHNQPGKSHLDLQLAVSRDTVHFQRVGDRTTFLPCGGIGTWDRFNNSIATGPPLRVDDELRFYYGGRSYRHGPYEGDDNGIPGGGIGLATIPVDRFVSMAGSYDGARITTKPLVVKNGDLCLNCQAKFGKITVEVLDESDQVVAKSEPVRADSLREVVRWETGALPGGEEAVRLRFLLENAHLYAFWSE